MANPRSSAFSRPAPALLPAAALLFCLGFLAPGASWGVPADPAPVEVSQPGGARIKISLKGDEFYHWNEDAEGYAIFQDTATRNWVYGEKDSQGALKAGKYIVGAGDPAGIARQKHFIDAEKAGRANARRARRDSSAAFNVPGSRTVTAAQSPPGPAKIPILTGTMKNLVILAAFSDVAPTHTQAEVQALFNTPGYTTDGAVGSVWDYYQEVSYSKLSVVSVVTQWVTLPRNQAWYGADVGGVGNDSDPQQMVRDAIDLLEASGFNFSTVDGNGDGLVDGLDIIHSGVGQESAGNPTDSIWSHKWGINPVTYDGVTMGPYHTEPEMRGAGPSITRIGVICHETGHFLGLPDLYDTTYNSSGAGSFCLMAGGSWNGVDGKSPAHMSAWCKKYLGWAAATPLSAYGANTLPRIEDNDTALYSMRNVNFGANEYFLLENRQGYGFDSGLPGPNRGMLIWHVDESKLNNGNNDDKTHYLVDLEEAGGTQDLENNTSDGNDADYYRSGNNAAFGDETAPNSRSYLGYYLNLPIQGISATANTMSFVLADLTAPAAIANVYDGATPGSDISNTGSPIQLSANWTASSDPESGLKAYWYAIGASPGSAEVVAWRDNGLLTSTTAAGLSLTNGTTYYFSVKAVNGLDMESSVASSNGQRVNISMPVNVPYVYDGTGADLAYARSLGVLSANWGASPSESITKYWYAIGTTPGGEEKLAFTDNGPGLSVTKTGLSLSDGATYYFAVKAQNALGYYSSTVASNGQLVDVTSPTARVLITSSTGALKTGTMTVKLITAEANGLSANPSLSFTPPGGSVTPIPLTFLVSSTWTGTAYIESYYSTGTASFGFSASDPAGNAGAQLTSGGTFLIDTSINGAAGGTVANSDATSVSVPAGGYSGSLVIRVSTVSAARTAAADAAMRDSYPVYAPDLTREFSARDSVTGALVTVFASSLTLKMYYPDADNDGYMDGNLISENLARFYLLNETLNLWTPVGDAVPSAAGNSFTFQTPHFSVYTIRMLDISRLGMSVIKAYPNPCYLDKPPFGLHIDGIPLDASQPKAYIYNTAGELVRTLSRGDGIDSANRAVWDGKVKGGGKAASGLYMYVLVTGNYGKAHGKVYIFR